MRLANKIAIITGAGSGIGRASARLFAREGAKVVVADVNDAGGEETVADIKANSGEAIFVHTDVSAASEVKHLVKVTMDKFGRIDILFNNAGILTGRSVAVEDLEESVWDRTHDINVKSVFLGAKYAVPEMKRARRGVIINTASMGGIRPWKYSTAYASSKGAVIALTKSLAIELASFGIRVNCINPTATDTPLIRQYTPKNISPEEFTKQWASTIPLGHVVTVEDVAYAALYLASDESAMLTGTGINVDGGRGI